MTKPNDCAFPSIEVGDGLTKREYFAALAMQGMVSGLYVDPSVININNDITARDSVSLADALINELNKEENG